MRKMYLMAAAGIAGLALFVSFEKDAPHSEDSAVEVRQSHAQECKAVEDAPPPQSVHAQRSAAQKDKSPPILPEELRGVYEETVRLQDELAQESRKIASLQQTIEADEERIEKVTSQADAVLKEMEEKGVVDLGAIRSRIERGFSPTIEDPTLLPDGIKGEYLEALQRTQALEEAIEQIDIIEEEEEK